MKMKVIKDEELVVGKEYSLANSTIVMIISFANGGMLAKYGGLQMRFQVDVGTVSFFVGEGILFLPTTDGPSFKIIARKSGDDKGIKPNWKYFLVRYQNK